MASIAKDNPQSAYAAMVFSIQHRWRHIQQTLPNISDLFKDLENEIHHTLLPAIQGREISSQREGYHCTILPASTRQGNFFTREGYHCTILPARYGGMEITKPEEWSDFEFEASEKVTEKPKAIIIRQDFDTHINATEMAAVKREVENEEILLRTTYKTILCRAEHKHKRALDNAQQKGASSCPLHGLDLCRISKNLETAYV